MESITRDQYHEWKSNPVTEMLFDKIHEEREDMKEGLVNSAYENPEEVKGRCRAIAQLLSMTFHDLVPSNFTEEIEELTNE